MGRRPYLESSSTASLLHVGQGQEEVSDSGEVVVGVLSGLLLVLLVLTIGVAVLCLGRWGEGVRAELLSLYSVKVGGSQKEEVVEEKEVLTSAPSAPPPPPPPPPPPAAPLTQVSPTSVQPQLFTPIWMEEIHKNKIFAKQKLIMQTSAEDEKLVNDASTVDVEVNGDKLEESVAPADGESEINKKEEESPLPESDQVIVKRSSHHHQNKNKSSSLSYYIKISTAIIESGSSGLTTKGLFGIKNTNTSFSQVLTKDNELDYEDLSQPTNLGLWTRSYQI